MEDRNLNIPNVTVGEVVGNLSQLYINWIKHNRNLHDLPTPFLWGPAGVGKSEAVVQLADRLAVETGKTVSVTDVRLLLFSPVDLRGVPVADEHKKFSNWLRPKIFDMNPADDHINFLFLDELSAAPQSVQAAAYQICLDRKIGEHKLPENCIVIAAGNRTTDQSISYKMPKALCNRLMHFNVEANFHAWQEWARAHDIDSRIVGYLAFDNSRLCVEPDGSELAYPTPRSWSYVSNLIRGVENIETMHTLIGACVGNDAALEFELWEKSHEDLPDVEDILRGVCTVYPKKHDALLVLIGSLETAIREKRHYLTVEQLENACIYAKKFPADFQMVFYSDLQNMEFLRAKLVQSATARVWFTKNKQTI